MATSIISTTRPLIVESKIINIGNIPAYDSYYGNIDISKPGWTPLGIVGWANGGSSAFYLYQLNHLNNTAYARGRNISGSAISGASVTFNVLYMKN